MKNFLMMRAIVGSTTGPAHFKKEFEDDAAAQAWCEENSRGSEIYHASEEFQS